MSSVVRSSAGARRFGDRDPERGSQKWLVRFYYAVGIGGGRSDVAWDDSKWAPMSEKTSSWVAWWNKGSVDAECRRRLLKNGLE